MKTTAEYWNPLLAEHDDLWSPIRGLEGVAKELTLSTDPRTAV
jgi:hypothetical protein